MTLIFLCFILLDLPADSNVTAFEMTMTFRTHMRYWMIDVWNLTYTAKFNGDAGQTFSASNEPMVNNNQSVFGVTGKFLMTLRYMCLMTHSMCYCMTYGT